MYTFGLFINDSEKVLSDQPPLSKMAYNIAGVKCMERDKMGMCTISSRAFNTWKLAAWDHNEKNWT